jgi:hypothetical protein
MLGRSSLTGIIELRKSQRTQAMESVMAEEYDKERAAALIKEARELTSHLKDEAEKIKAQMERVLEGGEDEFLDAQEGEKPSPEHNILEGVVPRKPFWKVWR